MGAEELEEDPSSVMADTVHAYNASKFLVHTKGIRYSSWAPDLLLKGFDNLPQLHEPRLYLVYADLPKTLKKLV
jgi:hypothetical protein